MKQMDRENARKRRLRAVPLILTLLAATGKTAMGKNMTALSHIETVMGPLAYYSHGLVPPKKPDALPSPEAGETHTVNYYLQEPAGGTWLDYYTEEQEHGRLPKGPLYSPIDPAGKYEQVFIGWYRNMECTEGPVNLLQTPVTGDMRLYARFGSEAERFEPEGFEVVITVNPVIGISDGEAASDPSGEAQPEPEPLPSDILAAITAGGEGLPENLMCTITAQVAGIPENVRYDLQWQNDLSGTLENVPGETGTSIVFPATPENLNCQWRVAIVF